MKTSLRFLIAIVIVFVLAPGTITPAFADRETAEPPDLTAEMPSAYSVDTSSTETQISAAQAAAAGISSSADSQGKDAGELSLDALSISSESDAAPPEVGPSEFKELDIELLQEGSTKDERGIVYTTTLKLNGISSFYGYQIEVQAANQDSVAINNLVGGMTTDAVYKDGSMHQAVLLNGDNPLSGDILLCEILSRFPLDEDAANHILTVTKLQAVTSLSSGSMLSAGPDPVAARLALAADSFAVLPSDVSFLVIVMAVVLLVAAVLLYRYIRSRKSRRYKGAHLFHSNATDTPR